MSTEAIQCPNCNSSHVASLGVTGNYRCSSCGSSFFAHGRLAPSGGKAGATPLCDACSTEGRYSKAEGKCAVCNRNVCWKYHCGHVHDAAHITNLCKAISISTKGVETLVKELADRFLCESCFNAARSRLAAAYPLRCEACDKPLPDGYPPSCSICGELVHQSCTEACCLPERVRRQKAIARSFQLNRLRSTASWLASRVLLVATVLAVIGYFAYRRGLAQYGTRSAFSSEPVRPLGQSADIAFDVGDEVVIALSTTDWSSRFIIPSDGNGGRRGIGWDITPPNGFHILFDNGEEFHIRPDGSGLDGSRYRGGFRLRAATPGQRARVWVE